MRRPAFRALACGLAALLLAGCSTWHATQLAEPVPGLPAAKPHVLRILTLDGRTVALNDWTIDGDSLRGTREAYRQLGETREPEAVAVRDVQELIGAPGPWEHLRVHFSDGRTIGLAYPRVDGDSLRGFTKSKNGLRPVAFARASVQSVEARKFSGSKTGGLIVGLVVAASALVVGFFVWAMSLSD